MFDIESGRINEFFRKLGIENAVSPEFVIL